MKILVTGSDGFLGKSVVRKLNYFGYNVVTVSRRLNSGNNFYANDLGSSEELILLLESVNPEIIINLAANIDLSEGVNISSLYSINSLCPSIIADWSKKNNAYLVQASSIGANGLNHILYNQNTPETPDTNYGLSKYLADKMILASGCEFAILRFGGLFGKNGPRHLGINTAIMNSAKGIVPNYIGTGNAKRNYLYVEDAALIIELCVRKRLLGKFYCGGEILSIKDMLTFISDAFLKGLKPNPINGADSQDQIIEVSSEVKLFRNFLDCLYDCK